MDKETIQEFIENHWDELQEEYRTVMGIKESDELDEYFDEDAFYAWAENEAIQHSAELADMAFDKHKEQ